MYRVDQRMPPTHLGADSPPHTSRSHTGNRQPPFLYDMLWALVVMVVVPYGVALWTERKRLRPQYQAYVESCRRRLQRHLEDQQQQQQGAGGAAGGSSYGGTPCKGAVAKAFTPVTSSRVRQTAGEPLTARGGELHLDDAPLPPHRVNHTQVQQQQLLLHHQQQQQVPRPPALYQPLSYRFKSLAPSPSVTPGSAAVAQEQQHQHAMPLGQSHQPAADAGPSAPLQHIPTPSPSMSRPFALSVKLLTPPDSTVPFHVLADRAKAAALSAVARRNAALGQQGCSAGTSLATTPGWLEGVEGEGVHGGAGAAAHAAAGNVEQEQQQGGQQQGQQQEQQQGQQEKEQQGQEQGQQQGQPHEQQQEQEREQEQQQKQQQKEQQERQEEQQQEQDQEQQQGQRKQQQQGQQHEQKREQKREQEQQQEQQEEQLQGQQQGQQVVEQQGQQQDRQQGQQQEQQQEQQQGQEKKEQQGQQQQQHVVVTSCVCVEGCVHVLLAGELQQQQQQQAHSSAYGRQYGAAAGEAGAVGAVHGIQATSRAWGEAGDERGGGWSSAGGNASGRTKWVSDDSVQRAGGAEETVLWGSEGVVLHRVVDMRGAGCERFGGTEEEMLVGGAGPTAAAAQEFGGGVAAEVGAAVATAVEALLCELADSAAARWHGARTAGVAGGWPGVDGYEAEGLVTNPNEPFTWRALGWEEAAGSSPRAQRAFCPHDGWGSGACSQGSGCWRPAPVGSDDGGCFSGGCGGCEQPTDACTGVGEGGHVRLLGRGDTYAAAQASPPAPDTPPPRPVQPRAASLGEGPVRAHLLSHEDASSSSSDAEGEVAACGWLGRSAVGQLPSSRFSAVSMFGGHLSVVLPLEQLTDIMRSEVESGPPRVRVVGVAEGQVAEEPGGEEQLGSGCGLVETEGGAEMQWVAAGGVGSGAGARAPGRLLWDEVCEVAELGGGQVRGAGGSSTAAGLARWVRAGARGSGWQVSSRFGNTGKCGNSKLGSTGTCGHSCGCETPAAAAGMRAPVQLLYMTLRLCGMCRLTLEGLSLHCGLMPTEAVVLYVLTASTERESIRKDGGRR